ncbi:MAG: prolipoprotein diacylglyceryl transferase family protein [Candidatus Promineifilaceae bacterium]
MFPTLSLGPVVLPTAGIVYILGVWLLLSVIEKAAKALNLNVEATYNLATLTLVVGLIGARVIFVALHWSAYQENLIGIVWPLTSGFDIWGGLIFGLAAAFFYGRYRQLPPFATLDALLPGLLIAFIIISLADFLGGPGYGKETSLFWGIDLFGIRRHPVQIYEIVVGVLALTAWWRTLPHRTFDGQLFLIGTAVYSAGRLLVDAFRANAWLTNSGYHVLQILSLFILLASLLILARKQSASPRMTS